MSLPSSSIAHLPEIPGTELSLACDVDAYDGPITGLVRRGAELWWFDWLDEDTTAPGQGALRRYSLHALPADLVPAAETWMAGHQAFAEEFRLVANQHVWPLTDAQRASLRARHVVSAAWEAHGNRRPRWEDLPPTAWFTESGQDFAAIRTFTLDEADAEAFPRWQREVAQALHAEDQAALDRLFPLRYGPSDPLDIYYVSQPGGRQPYSCRVWGREELVPCIVRDWRGQPLPEDFQMTSRHRVQCFDGLLTDSPP